MRFELIALIAATTSVTAQAVVGTAYGFGVGATGGGSAAAVTPTSNDELAKYLLDDVARTILITKTFDFTGTTSTGAGCDKSTCKAASGGQFYLGDLSCSGSGMTAVSSIKYDTAGPTQLVVGSNKSILGVGGKGVLKGKGLQLKQGASNIIIQGIYFTTINPEVVWGGDALDFKGGNTKVWVDHCKFSQVGREFIVSHFDGASATLSNNEFDGVTTHSATCNNNHYWTLMMIGKNEKFTIDKNYFHDVSGRAPKLGQPGVTGYFHAVNNYFENMKGHAFDAYDGANALVEGNVFQAVSQPSTDSASKVATFVVNAGTACSSALGRTCLANSVDSTSGKLSGGSTTSFLSTIGSNAVSKPLAVTEVAAHVKANAGPANLGATGAATEAEVKPSTTSPAAQAAATTSIKAAAQPTTSSSSSGTAKLYGQCGGQGYSGPTACPASATCVESNTWFSQCITRSSKFRRALRI